MLLPREGKRIKCPTKPQKMDHILLEECIYKDVILYASIGLSHGI